MKTSTIKTLQIFTVFFSIADIMCLYGFINTIQSLINQLSIGIMLNHSDFLIFFGLLNGMIFCSLCSQYGFNKLPILGKKAILETYETRLLNEDHAFFAKNSTAFLISLFQNEISLLGQQEVTFPVVLIVQCFSLISGAAFLFFNEWKLALILFFLIGICFGTTRILSRKIAQNAQKVYDEKNTLFQVLHENIEAHRLIRFLNKEKFFSERFTNQLDKSLVPVEKRQGKINACYITIYSILSRVLPLLSAGIGLVFVALGSMTMGKVISAYALVSLVQEPIMQLAEIRTQKHTMKKLRSTIKQVFSEPKESMTVFEDLLSPLQRIDVQIDQFFYSGSPLILQDLAFSIEPGQNTKLSGPSGTGKSTLMNLIMNALEGNDCHLFFNRKNITSFSQAWRAHHLLMVDQKSKLFKMSILENIVLDDSFSQAEIDEILYTCVLDDVLAYHKNSILDDNSGLSQGQAQRVSIARMLIRKPDFLILDEPISALDEHTASLLIQRIHHYTKHHHITLIISSHNKATDTLCVQNVFLPVPQKDRIA